MHFSWSVVDIWHWMGLISRITLLALATMSLCTAYTLLLHSVERAKAFIATRVTIQALKQKRTLREAISSLKDRNRFPVIVLAGLEAFQSAPSSFSNAEAMQLAESAMQRCERTVRLDAQRGLIPLDTVVNIAPSIGMFATIFGILNAFQGHSTSKATALEMVSAGIALALIPLVLGLALAATAAWGYAYVSRGIQRLDEQNDSLIREVVAYLQTQSREQMARDSGVYGAPMTRIQREHHRGTRLMICALWAWWLLPGVPMGIGIVWGVYSLFTNS